jgi:hypothetical protein
MKTCLPLCGNGYKKVKKEVEEMLARPEEEFEQAVD